MEPIQFKTSLFGFSKDQVIEYILRMDQQGEKERSMIIEQYNTRLNEMKREMDSAKRMREHYQRQAAQSAEEVKALQEQIHSLLKKAEEGDLLQQRLEETAAEREHLQQQYQALEAEMEKATREALERENRLSDFIDRVQEKNVELLHKQVAMEIRLSSAERKLYSATPSARSEEGASSVDVQAKEEIITALDAILTKLDALSPRQEEPGMGRLYRLTD